MTPDLCYSSYSFKHTGNTMDRQYLETLSTDALLQQAANRNISNRHTLSRDNLISAIIAWDNI